MRALILSALASLVSTWVIATLGRNIGWDVTATLVVLIHWWILLIPQLIVRLGTSHERLAAKAGILEEADKKASDNLQREVKHRQSEVERIDREIETLNNMCEQIKKEIVRMGGCVLVKPVSLSGGVVGGGGVLSGDLRVQVTEPKSKWRTIKKPMGKAWNGLRRRWRTIKKPMETFWNELCRLFK